MEPSQSIFEHELFIDDSIEQVNITSKWTQFIGIVYGILGILILTMTVFMIINLDELAQILMKYNGMNEQVMELIRQWGVWLFGLAMLGMALVVFLNAYFLLRFRISFMRYAATQIESHFGDAFESVGKYFMVTTILSILSTLSSIGLIIYTIIR